MTGLGDADGSSDFIPFAHGRVHPNAGRRTEFSYDLANRLVSTGSGSTTSAYEYDGDGLRSRSTIANSGVQTEQTDYLWDINFRLPQLAVERDHSTGSTFRDYLYGIRRVSMSTGGSDYYYHYDALGSVTKVTSETGSEEWS